MSKLKKFAALGAALLSAASAGCAVDSLSPWNWKPEVPDVHPVRKSRSDAAVEAFDRQRNRAQFLAAQSSWQQGDYDRCRESLEKVLERDPNHREALMLLADVGLETDHPEEAVETLRRLSALDPRDAEAAYRLGLSLEATGDLREALPYLRQAAANDPTNSKYADARDQAEGQLAEIATIAADVKTEDAAEQKGPAAPANANDQLVAEAVADWEAGRDEAAATKIAELLDEQPDHIDANILQAEIELSTNRRGEALERMERLSAAHPRDARVFRAFGLLCDATGDAPRAARCFAQARLLSRAEVTAETQSPNGVARQPVVQATFVEPPDGVQALTSLGDEMLTPPEPPTAAMLNGDAAEQLREGQRHLKSGRIDEARRTLRSAVEYCGDDSKTAIAAAVAALKAEQPALSYELATLGAVRFPTSAGLQQVRGMAAYRMRRYSEAEAALRQSLSLDNSQALSYFLLGSALEHLGQPEAGGRYRSEAARLDTRYALHK